MIRTFARRSLPSLLLVMLLPALFLFFYSSSYSRADAPDAADWHRWRGPAQNGISDQLGLVDRFDPAGGADGNVLWKSEEAAGISTPIVMGGRLYTIVRDQPDTPRDGEKVLCLEAVTGRKLWENRYNVFLSDVPAERIGWSNCAGDPTTGRVYALGSSCLLQCLRGDTGETVWERSLGEEFGMLSTYGGRTNTPVVFEDLVIVSGVTTGWDETARPTHRFLALDKNDGRLIWISGTRPLPEDTTYSTPALTVIDDQALMITGSGDGGVHGIQPRTGKIVWSYRLSRRGVNVSPVVADGRVFVGHSEENPEGNTMGAVVAIDASGMGDVTKSGEIWKVDELTMGKSSPLLVDDRLYAIDDSAGLHVLDARTGRQIGRAMKLGSAMRGSPLWADGKIYACSATGIFHVLQPDEGGVKSVFRTRLPRGEETGGSPIAWSGRIYLPTTGGLYCLGAAGETSRAPASGRLVAEQSSPSTESTSEGDSTPAIALLVPAEATVEPGGEIRFEARLFDKLGRGIKEPVGDVAFGAAGGGTVDRAGRFVAPSGSEHGASVVTASVAGLTARARVRVVPSLSEGWRFDFADGKVPVTWIGARYRHESRVDDGEAVIVKISTIPKGTRSQSWMGPTDLRDYTIQADLKAGAGASGGSGQLPDMGVIAQRYTLDMMGQSQQLQIRSWPPQLRMARTVPFSWKGGVWYTVKLRASVDEDKATLQGKVWERDRTEPDQWTITAEDPAPNRRGSPGLFGNATNAEIFIDNVRVVAD